MATKTINTGIIGFGKRMTMHTLPVIEYLPEYNPLRVLTRSDEKKEDIIKRGFEHFTQCSNIFLKDLDLVVVSVPPKHIESILENLKNFSGKILLETPVSDSLRETIKRFRKFGHLKNIFYLEQFPLVPHEQLKKKVQKNYDLGNCLYTENINRSFAYHGFAQLRSFNNNHGKLKKIRSSRTRESKTNHMINFGILEFENLTVQHSFSADIKNDPNKERGHLKYDFSKGSIAEKYFVTGDGQKVEFNFSYQLDDPCPIELKIDEQTTYASPFDSNQFNCSQAGVAEILKQLNQDQYSYNLKQAAIDTALCKILSFDQKFKFPLATKFLIILFNWTFKSKPQR